MIQYKIIFLQMKKISLILIVFCFLSSCETLDLNQIENPSTTPVDKLEPVFAFNYVQIELPKFINATNNFTQAVTRQMAMTGGNTYDNAFAPVNFDFTWAKAYNILNTIKALEPKAKKQNATYVLGASKVIRCYILLCLTDMFGDIPVTNALQGNDNLLPTYDKSADVYKTILVELEQAKLILNTDDTSKIIVSDLYYANSKSWITLANTLKLKMLVTAKNAGSEIGISDLGLEIKSILTENNIIDTIDEDFQFKYGNSRFSPNTRHPLYNDQYELGGGAYIGNYFMWAMSTEKGFSPTITAASDTDPRLAFYFFKQDSDPAGEESFVLPIKTRPDHYNLPKFNSFFNNSRVPYLVSNWTSGLSIASNGYWGRDHGDNSGIPPDAEKRTVGGIYPIGGNYGTAGSVQTGGDKGALGAGIMPMILSSYVHFLISEAANSFPSSVGASINPLNELKIAISQSIDKTVNFAPNFVYLPGTKPTQVVLDNQKIFYLDFIETKYNQASTNKLELIIKEFYLASWGNGIEPYNNYRRTGYPSNFQPTLELSSDPFYYTAYYPGNAVNNNPNVPANVRTRKVFWDKSNLILN